MERVARKRCIIGRESPIKRKDNFEIPARGNEEKLGICTKSLLKRDRDSCLDGALKLVAEMVIMFFIFSFYY